jgi:hypothetical protein
MYEDTNPGPTHALRVVAGLVGIIALIVAAVIWGEMGTIEVPGSSGLSFRTRTELNPVPVAVGAGILLGGLLLSASCFVLAAISENIAGMREDAEPDEEEPEEDDDEQAN